MRTSIAACLAAGLVGLLLTASPRSQSRDQFRVSDSLERPFPSGGRVRMNLSAGEYRIEGTTANRIHIEWKVRDPDQLWRVKARADVRGADAKIETDGPTNGGVHAVIRLPTRTDLDVRMSAGEIAVEGIDGNKEIDLYAGEIDVNVGRAADYKRVDASVWAGEINAPAFGRSKEGLFRSFGWEGTGPYNLRVKLWAGEVRLYATGSR